MLELKGRDIGGFLVFSRLYTSLGIGVLAWGVAELLGAISTIKFVMVVFLITFGSYLFNKSTDITEDNINLPKEASFISSNRETIKISAGLLLFAGMVLSLLVDFFLLLAVLIPPGLGILYSASFLPNSFRYRRLKEVPLLNTFSVAFGIPFLIIATSFFVGGTDILTGLVLFLFLFLEVLIGTEIPNMEDIAGDKAAGVRTLPMIYGVDKTKKILHVVNTLALLLFYSSIFIRLLPQQAILPGLVTIASFPIISRTEEENAKKMEMLFEFNVTYLFGILTFFSTILI